MEYLNFDLQIQQANGGYRASILSSPVGQATHDFQLPFSELELENFFLRIGRPRRNTRRIGTSEATAIRKFGGQLFDATFGPEVLVCLNRSLDVARGRDMGLRIRLRLSSAPELSNLPWEYLRDPRWNRTFSLSNETPVVRYLDLPMRDMPIQVDGALNVLVMVASPANVAKLNVEHEWESLLTALDPVRKSGSVQITRLQGGSLVALQRCLQRGAYHVFHFIGHGAYDPECDDGFLLMEDAAGGESKVSGESLGITLRDHRELRLAILNACEGARSGLHDPFAGVAHSLVQQGIPAVVAMQFEITDEAAIIFARELYSVIALGMPIDASLAESRKAILNLGNDVEWGTPVLYLRSPDSQLFNVRRAKESPLQEPEKQTTPPRQQAVPHEEASIATPAAASLRQRERWKHLLSEGTGGLLSFSRNRHVRSAFLFLVFITLLAPFIFLGINPPILQRTEPPVPDAVAEPIPAAPAAQQGEPKKLEEVPSSPPVNVSPPPARPTSTRPRPAQPQSQPPGVTQSTAPTSTTVLRSNQDQVLSYKLVSEGPGLIVFEVDYTHDPAHSRPMFMRVIVYSEPEGPADSGKPRLKVIARGLSDRLAAANGKVRVDARKLLDKPTASSFVEVVLLEEAVPVSVKHFQLKRLWGPA